MVGALGPLWIPEIELAEVREQRGAAEASGLEFEQRLTPRDARHESDRDEARVALNMW